MADCSYYRCIQERRFVKRELQKWSKDMVYIVGLERVAEELMGRRKWKQYQDSSAQSNATDLLEKQSPSIEQQETSNKLQEAEENKAAIKTEALDIKEETKLMTVEDVSKKTDSDIKTEGETSSSSTLEFQQPIDWKPQDKCYFCVDGKLLKVNEIGELVVEAGPVQPEVELNRHIIESDDSSSGSDTTQKPENHQQPSTSSNDIPKNLEAFLKSIAGDSNMTSLESMAAAQLAAFQRIPELSHLNPFYPNVFFQQFQQQISPTTTPDRSSPLIKVPISADLAMSSPTNQSGEQPLDLSAKPGGSSVDSKNIFKAKPRISTVPGRRSYTEEELNNALQDILSGKLGTRRAAVLYGIPRSTLRNKVYKLAIEQKRELLANNPPIAVLENDDDDKDSEPEDDKNLGKSNNSNDQLQAYLKLFQNSQQMNVEQKSKNWQMDPNTLLQSLLLANASGLGGIGGFPSLFPSSSKEELPEFLRKLLTQPQDLKSSDNEKVENMVANNGPSNSIDRLSMLNLFQQQYNNKLSSHQHSLGTPDIDLDGSDDSTINSSILKVPSVKSLYGAQSSSGQSKNGDVSNSTPSASPKITSVLSTSPHLQAGSMHQSSLANHLSMRSPSSLHRQRSESSSPPTAKFNLHDVIRQSISKNFQSNLLEDPKHSTPLMIDPMDQYHKRPSISVIKSLGGTDISRFGSNPNITQLTPQQLSPNNTGTGGKGTRPKRGKYRNYDRDSLVEAVKAVQRGEMSVHRAGSYYGVPHSTLEYKVKERHLMRPRKREPKPQPLDSGGTSSGQAKPDPVGGIRPLDKSKTPNSSKPIMKSPYSPSNGMKMPPFLDPAMAAQLQYTSQLFWQHSGNFPTMPGLDFSRGTTQNTSSAFSPNADNFFTQQMLQKIQDDQQQQFKSPVNGNQNSSTSNNKPAENLFDSVATNGSSSFLDGIIRQSLDKKPSELNHGTLFEQLLKNTKNSILNNSGPSDDNGFSSTLSKSNKRLGSPLDFAQHSEIKRERVSPPHNNTDTDYLSLMQSHLCDNLSMKEELNGSLKNDLSDTNS